MTKINSSSIFHKHFLNAKTSLLSPKSAISVLPDEPLERALRMMTEKKIGSVLICDLDGGLKGIFTERDPILKLLPNPFSLLMYPIKEFMTRDVVSVRAGTSIARSIYEMVAGGFRHLIVLEEKKEEKAIISARDIVSYLYRNLTKKLSNPDNQVIFDKLKVDSFFASTLEVIPLETANLVSPNASVLETAQNMRLHKTSFAIIAENEKSVRGIFTERDLLDKVLPKKIALSELKIADFEVKFPKTMLTTASVSLAFEYLCDGGFRHFPIVNSDEKLVGILTIRSFLRAIAENIIADLS